MDNAGGGSAQMALPGALAPHMTLGLNSRPVFQPGQGPNTMGSAYQPLQREGHTPQTYQDIIADQKRLEEVQYLFQKSSLLTNSLSFELLFQ